ncbi:MAG: dihydroorotase [Proteobacteria bacterium]|nr:MAG: dihydroorotase [Pseudomonadota bacterium]
MGDVTQLTIRTPDDWHLHLRDGEMLKAVVPYTAEHFARAIVMPNLVPPVVRTEQAVAYRERIFKALPEGSKFQPLMTLYLTEQTDPADVRAGFERGDITALKLYPAGATTNSDAGVKNIEAVYPVLETMQALGIPLLIHGEVVDPDIDIFDREAVFIERTLSKVRETFPALKIVLEHITTADGVAFVKSCESNMAATITPHHLTINRNAMLVGGIQPHYYCLPVAKREVHREALVEAATSGDARFFLGTDSAPHLDGAKESACGCAGIFNVSVTLSTLAHVFENAGRLENLEKFTSLNGPAFYSVPANESTICLEKGTEALDISEKLQVAGGTMTLFDPKFPLLWRVLV